MYNFKNTKASILRTEYNTGMKEKEEVVQFESIKSLYPTNKMHHTCAHKGKIEEAELLPIDTFDIFTDHHNCKLIISYGNFSWYKVGLFV